DRVLSQMREIGLRATELGADGFLPAAPEGKAETLNRYELQGLGNSPPVVLHDPQRDPRSEVDRVLDGFEAVGAKILVLSAITGLAVMTAGRSLTSTVGRLCWATW